MKEKHKPPARAHAAKGKGAKQPPLGDRGKPQSGAEVVSALEPPERGNLPRVTTSQDSKRRDSLRVISDVAFHLQCRSWIESWVMLGS